MSSQDKGTPRPTKPKAGNSDYQPTEEEHAVIRKMQRTRLRTRFKTSKRQGAFSVTPDHIHEATGTLLLMEALGTGELDFYRGLVAQLANAASRGSEPDEDSINFMLSVIKGIQPRDQVEAMLASQMAAVHMATMTFARRLAHVENILQQDSAERAFNKLVRTFAAQIEALKRYRTGGEQKVTVQHVTVSEGGQAIVGNVTHGVRQRKPAASQPPLLADTKAPPMPIIEESRNPAPIRASKKK